MLKNKKFTKNLRRSMYKPYVMRVALLPMLTALALAVQPGGTLKPTFEQYELPASSPHNKSHHDIIKQDMFTLYIPDWLGDSSYARLSPLLSNRVKRNVAFALPNTDATITMPKTTTGLTSLLTSADTGLSIGGWGGETDAEHLALIETWRAVLKKPKEFATAVTSAANSMHASTIDLDFEYPEQADKTAFLELVREIRKQNPDRCLTLAVPATALEGYALAEDELPSVVDHFNVMTYDYSGTWSQAAGYHADGLTTLNAINTWVQAVGDASKVSPGFVTYGFSFVGAKKAGDPFTPPVKKVIYSDLVAAKTIVTDDEQKLASFAVVDGNWTSLQSPAMIARIYKEIKKRHPTIAPAFFWSSEGFSAEHAAAVKNQ